MSRIGKKIIPVPSGVEIQIENQKVFVKGKLGSLSREFHSEVAIHQEAGGLVVGLRNSNRQTLPLWGLSRTLLSNMVVGVSQGFSKSLEIIGVGYKAAVQGDKLNLNLGFSHEVNYPIPEGVVVTVEKNTLVTVRGPSKEVLGKMCAEIHEMRPPEPYKGKGIRYTGEYVRRKEGKKSKKK